MARKPKAPVPRKEIVAATAALNQGPEHAADGPAKGSVNSPQPPHTPDPAPTTPCEHPPNFVTPGQTTINIPDPSYVLSLLTYQDGLLQSYRGLHFTFQSIVVAIAAAVTGSALTSDNIRLFQYYWIILLSMFLASRLFGIVLSWIIGSCGEDVNHLQRTLKEVDERAFGPSGPYAVWLDTRKLWQTRGARNKLKQFTTIWVSWIWFILLIEMICHTLSMALESSFIGPIPSYQLVLVVSFLLLISLVPISMLTIRYWLYCYINRTLPANWLSLTLKEANRPSGLSTFLKSGQRESSS